MSMSNLTSPLLAPGKSSLSALSSSQPPFLFENIPINANRPDDDSEDEVYLDLSLCQAPGDSLGRVVAASSLKMTPTKRMNKREGDLGPPISKSSSTLDATLYASPPPFLLPVSKFASVEDEQIEGEMSGREETAIGSSSLISTSSSKEYDFGSWQMRSPPTLSYFHNDDAAFTMPMFDPLYDDDRLTGDNNVSNDFNFTVNPQEIWHSALSASEDNNRSGGDHSILTDLAESHTFSPLPPTPPPPPPPILFQLPNDTSFGDYLNLPVDDDDKNHELDYGLNCSFDLPVPLAPSSHLAPPPPFLRTDSFIKGTSSSSMMGSSKMLDSRNILETLTDDELRDFGYSSQWPREGQREEDVYYSLSRLRRKAQHRHQDEEGETMESQRRRALIDLQRRLLDQSTHMREGTTVSPSSTLSLSQTSSCTTATTSSDTTTTSTSSTTPTSTPSASLSSVSSSAASPNTNTNTTTIKATGDRARNACKHCHKRKTKCTEERPTCLHCQQVGAICEYPTEIRRRGKGKNNCTRREASSTSTSSSSHNHRRSHKSSSNAATAPSSSSYRGQSVHSDDSYTPSSGYKRSKR